MKRIIAYAFFAVLIAACNNSSLDDKIGKKGGKNDDDRRTGNDDDPGRNDKGRWTKKERDYFINECIRESGNSQQAETACPCVADKLEKIYPDFDDALKASEEEGKKLALECLGRGGNINGGVGDDDEDYRGDEGNNNGRDDYNDDEDYSPRRNGAWTDAQRRQYVQSCASSVQQLYGYSTRQATSYCDCMTSKVEKKFSFQQASRMTTTDFQTTEWQQAAMDCQSDNY